MAHRDTPTTVHRGDRPLPCALALPAPLRLCTPIRMGPAFPSPLRPGTSDRWSAASLRCLPSASDPPGAVLVVAGKRLPARLHAPQRRVSAHTAKSPAGRLAPHQPVFIFHYIEHLFDWEGYIAFKIFQFLKDFEDLDSRARSVCSRDFQIVPNCLLLHPGTDRVQ